jgi:hypothetical protein
MNTKLPELPDFTTHELISSYHDGIQEAVNFIEERVVPTLQGQINLSKQEEAIIGVFYRIHLLANSLLRLNKKGDFNAVAVISRTVFELLLDIKFLSSPNIQQSQIDQFHAFPEVDRYRKAKRIVELQINYPELINNSLLDSVRRKSFVEYTGRSESIEQKVKSLWGMTKKGKVNWPDNWRGLSIKERAEEFGPLCEQEYLEVYSFLSSYTHGGSAAYSNLSEETLESVYGVSLEYARKMYIESLIMCSQKLKLTKGIESFSQILDFLKEAPQHILVQLGIKKTKE